MANVTTKSPGYVLTLADVELEKLYLGAGIACGLLILISLLVIVLSILCRTQRQRSTVPRGGRLVSYAQSDFDTYKPIGTSVFRTPSSEIVWGFRQQPSSPTPTITTLATPTEANPYIFSNISAKVLQDVLARQK